MDQVLQNNVLAFGLETDLAESLRDMPPREVVILADSLQQALRIGAREIDADLSDLDYEIEQKGNPGFLGIGRLPYRIRVKKMPHDNRWDDIEDLHVSLDTATAREELAANADGKILVRVYKNGIFLRITPARGNGHAVPLDLAMDRLHRAGISSYDRAIVEKEVKKPSGELVKVANWIPKQNADSSLTVEVSPDEMEAVITVTTPRPGGRHLQVQDVIRALKQAGVVYGYQENVIERALENDQYGTPIVAAKGEQPENGQDAFVDYKVRIDKKVEFKEDESGRVDFLSKELVENVVQGQVLAELVPAQSGKQGRTLVDRIIPAKNGKPIEMKPGTGTILSDDGRFLLAEKNGQVVFRQGRLNVEEVLTIPGDVGLDTGNIMFLGSVIVRGSVTDNMQVKAAGNIEIGGSVQKSMLEAEGDIIVRSGIQGRDGAKIESTTGSLYAKFIQNTYVMVEKDLHVQEGILHSHIFVGGNIVVDGKRAQVVGGELMAGSSLRSKQLGAQASTPTKIIVGASPKIIQQMKQLDEIRNNASLKLDKVQQNIRTLTTQKSSQGAAFPEEKEELLVKMHSHEEKLNERIKEVQQEKDQLQEYAAMLSERGAVHVEQTIYPGVTVEINGAVFDVKDEFHNVTLIEENGNIKILPYQEDEEAMKKDWRKRRGKKGDVSKTT